MKMEISTVKLIYFSPKGTTKKTLEGIAKGIGADSVEHINLTVPGTKPVSLPDSDSQLVIIGAPVYGGRLPGEAVKRLKTLSGKGIPVVIIVVYGNREFDNALFELKYLTQDMGLIPVAGGAFIGEHSFTSKESPIAVGRPDEQDIQKAMAFGESIRKKMESLNPLDDISQIDVPGQMPPSVDRPSSGESPKTQEDVCNKCGTCAEVCPTAAIIVGETVTTDGKQCIMCCACVKNCPTGARIMDSQRVKTISKWLSENCSKRKEPQLFI
jgi:ferredoxin